MLVDRYGRNVELGEWFIRLDQNNEGRIYRLDGYPADGRIDVQEFVAHEMGCEIIKSISPARLRQTIKKPRMVLWYPQSLLPVIIQ